MLTGKGSCESFKQKASICIGNLIPPYGEQKQSLEGETQQHPSTAGAATTEKEDGNKRQIQGTVVLPEEELQKGVQPETHALNLPILHHINHNKHHGE